MLAVVMAIVVAVCVGVVVVLMEHEQTLRTWPSRRRWAIAPYTRSRCLVWPYSPWVGA